MAAYAVLMNYIPSGLMNKNNLRLQAEGKHGGMAHSVFRFEEVLVEHVVVRYVAIVAIGVPAVRAVVPGGVLRCHNVAIDTSLGIIGQVGISFAHVKQEAKKSD
jgi:hypothetical protein